MTNYELELLYDKLVALQPHIYRTFDKKKSIFMAVQKMSKQWLESIIAEMQADPKLKINIEERARAFKFSNYRIVETKQIIAENENKTPESTEGLKNYLNELGAEDAVDAIAKVKNYGVAK